MQAPAAGDSLIGGTLGGKYRVLQQIGRGGMGVVYEAEHLGLGKRVAVKLMLEKYTDNTEAVARFHREALAAGRIGNPHIIEIFDIGAAPDGRSYVVMELLNGFPLSKVLEMGGPMPPWRAVQIMRQVLRAVGAAHAKGIIHRDLKPDNIFIINQGGDHDFVKLLDFGISKVVSIDERDAITTLTTTGVVMGTPLYMAPEQALGEPIDRYADIYACGVILYEMLAGRRPFDGPTYAALVAKVLTAAPPPLGELRPGLPAALVRAVHRALEKTPGDRFDSAEQFAAALPSAGSPASLELVGTVDGGVSAAMSAPPVPGRLRNVKIAAVAFTLAAAATAVALMLLDEGPPASAPTAAPPAAPGGLAAPGAPGGLPAPGASPEARTATPAPRPLPATGTLDVRSIPSGAAVIIDGREQGKTPLEVTLEEGRYQVRLELPGHVALTADADVRPSQRASVLVPLAAAPAPPGAARTVKPRPAAGAKPKPAPVTGDAPRPPAPSPQAAVPAPRPAATSPTAAPAPPSAEPKPTPTPAPPSGDPKHPDPAIKPNPYAK